MAVNPNLQPSYIQKSISRGMQRKSGDKQFQKPASEKEFGLLLAHCIHTSTYMYYNVFATFKYQKQSTLASDETNYMYYAVYNFKI